MIKTEQLCKRYAAEGGGVPVIRDLNLEISKGTCLLLQGPSGSGKSTLLNLLGCLARPTSGSVFLDGRNVSRLPDHFLTDVRRRMIGFVFQDFHLMPDHSALDNVGMPLVPLGIGPEGRREKAQALLRRVHMEHRANFKAKSLSGGEQQRVAVARALIHDPAIIIADEPNSNVDPENSRRILDLFHEFKSEGRTLVIASHDPAFPRNGLVDDVLRLGDAA